MWLTNVTDFKLFSLKLEILWALARKSAFYYSHKISEGRIKQINQENRESTTLSSRGRRET